MLDNIGEVEIVSSEQWHFNRDNFTIIYDKDSDAWYATHDNEEEFEDDVVIQDKEEPFEEKVLFGFYQLKEDEFKELQEIVAGDIANG